MDEMTKHASRSINRAVSGVHMLQDARPELVCARRDRTMIVVVAELADGGPMLGRWLPPAISVNSHTTWLATRC